MAHSDRADLTHLPATALARGDLNGVLLYAKVLHATIKARTMAAVSIVNQKSRGRLLPGAAFHNLLRCPIRCRMARHFDVEDFSAPSRRGSTGSSPLTDPVVQNYRSKCVAPHLLGEIRIQQTSLQEQLQRASVAESRRAYDLSLDKLRQGTIDQTTLLTVEQTLFAQEDILAQVRFARLEAHVSLFPALGGGWLEDDQGKSVQLIRQ
jgi:hypothetical protein